MAPLTDETRQVEISEAEDLLPAIDMATVASLGISMEVDGLRITSAPGLLASESPVGNDLCLVVSSSQVETGRICASAVDAGGLVLFTQDWTGGVAAAALTAAGVVVNIDRCEGEVTLASNTAATLTLCSSLEDGVTAADFTLRPRSDKVLTVTMPVLPSDG